MKHLLNKIASSRWAITPEALEAIWKLASREWTAADYETFHAASKGDLLALTSDLGAPLGESRNAFVRGDTGILLLDGPIIPRATSMSSASGMISIEALSADFKDFEANDSIKRILMLFDTPGGDVIGLADFAAIIRGSSKKTIAHIFGMSASAGYWLASQADVITSTPTGVVGSIGVMTKVEDGEEGIVIKSSQSPLKNDATSKDGRASVQKMVDDTADVFVTEIAAGRGITKEKVLADFGQGGLLVAAAALEVGMIDKINTLDGLMSSFEKPAPGGELGGIRMNLTQYLAENPAAAAELEGRLKAEFDRGKAEVMAASKVRIDAATPFLGSKYPADIQLIAAEVVLGTTDATALKIAASTHDRFAEQIASLEARLETQGNGNTTPPPELNEAQQVVADANKLRVAQGMKPHGPEVH